MLISISPFPVDVLSNFGTAFNYAYTFFFVWPTLIMGMIKIIKALVLKANLLLFFEFLCL